MLKTYFHNAWRNMMKHKFFTFINIAGLTIGLASFLLISLYIVDELAFDRMHSKANQIFRLVDHTTSEDGKLTKVAGAGYQVSERAITDIPGVVNVVRLLRNGRSNVSTTENNNVFYEPFLLGSPGLLTSFDFPLLQGDRQTAFTNPHSVVMTDEMANKLFHTNQVLGKLIKVDRDSTPFRITGVLQNFPINSHISFGLIFSESSLSNDAFKKFVSSDWTSDAFATYIQLDQKASQTKVQEKLNVLIAANREAKAKSTMTLQPLSAIHFYSNDIEGDSGRKGNIVYIYVFSVLALFVLLIACINYMNLATAAFAGRSKEIAVRKVAGASRANLVKQFFSEAFLISAIALIFALLLVEFLLPWFNDFTQKDLTLGMHTDYRIWFGVLAIMLLVVFISGIYPALFQSRLKPLLLLKQKVNVGKGNLSLRRGLVVFQFALSIIMIIATIVVSLQMKFISNKDMGFKKDQLLVVDINSGKVRRAAGTIKAELLKMSAVKAVSASSRVPGEWKDLPKLKVKNDHLPNVAGEDMYFLGVDDQFLQTYQIGLVEGRNFMPGSISDSSSAMINETAAKMLGIAQASGQILTIPMDQPFQAKVVGIVKDFNFQSLREPLAPMILGFQNNPVQPIDYFTIRVSTDAMAATLDQMNKIMQGIDKNHLFEYHFLDQQWSLFYQDDHIREIIFMIVAVLTILIACLGLLGLATYAAEQRIKEIGIRKVLGASVTGIVAMLSKDFLKLVLIAALIAIPVAGWAMHSWLQGYAYRIDISWWIFFAATLLALLIAFCTISFQAIKAAIANPVQSLRSE